MSKGNSTDVRVRVWVNLLNSAFVTVQGVGCRVSGVGCRVSGVGCRVSGVGCRVSGVG